MEIFLILSREHETLPLAELRAILDAENMDYDLKEVEMGVVKLKTDNEDAADIIAKRIAYGHEICSLIKDMDIDNLENDILSIDWKEIIDENFALRVKKIESLENDSQIMEKKFGALIKAQAGEKIKVKLEKPQTFIRVLVTGSRVLIGKRETKIDKKHFFNLKPHKRPFFYPGSMSPKLARCMINLSRAKAGDLLLDPFCGTGGILIEAGIIGTRILGTDIDEKMVKGAAKNLEYCGAKDFHIFQADARKLDLEEKVNAVVTDPPYGISASTAGEESSTIFRDFLKSISNNLLENGLICLASPHYVGVNDLIQGTEFKILERHEIRMHKSLTRVISVLGRTG
ncbi:MAG: TIGR01177 family methyltransferase [Methanobacteriaceae archaeon]|nr:TIGR01177 family methyltransferase [Methanobacteriaceae archaeon]MDP3624868.1 TIGR01177 family methyltransferase [Methanobacteriaceae archaeon]